MQGKTEPEAKAVKRKFRKSLDGKDETD